MRDNGQLVTCNHCGTTTFLKCIGEGERDGGFTRWNNFENLPEGWSHYYDGEDLCPECKEKFDIIQSEFETAEVSFKNKKKEFFYKNQDSEVTK